MLHSRLVVELCDSYCIHQQEYQVPSYNQSLMQQGSQNGYKHTFSLPLPLWHTLLLCPTDALTCSRLSVLPFQSIYSLIHQLLADSFSQIIDWLICFHCVVSVDQVLDRASKYSVKQRLGMVASCLNKMMVVTNSGNDNTIITVYNSGYVRSKLRATACI